MEHQPQRIDIELVPGDDRSPFARGADERTFVAGPPGPVPPRDDRRIVVAAIILGVVGLALGWLLGRASPSEVGSAERVDLAAATSVARNPNETIEPVVALIDEPVDEPASTVRASGAPALDRAEPDAESGDETIVESIVVAERLRGQPFELVIIGSDRDVVTLDLASGGVEVQTVGSQPFGRPDLLVGDDWALIPSNDPLLASTLLRRSARAAAVEVGTASDIVAAHGDALWVVADEDAVVDATGRGGGVVVRVLSLDGIADETVVIVPRRPVGADPAGGVVVAAPGGWFHADASAPHRITSGELLALGPNRAFAKECSDQLDCSLVVIDRATERRTPLALGSGSEDTRSWTLERLGGRAPTISPDGSAALVEVVDQAEPGGRGTVLGLVDLSTGQATRIGETVSATQHEFSPDGRFVFFIRSGAILVAYDRVHGVLVDVVDVAEGGLAPEAFGIRPGADR